MHEIKNSPNPEMFMASLVNILVHAIYRCLIKYLTHKVTHFGPLSGLIPTMFMLAIYHSVFLLRDTPLLCTCIIMQYC